MGYVQPKSIPTGKHVSHGHVHGIKVPPLTCAQGTLIPWACPWLECAQYVSGGAGSPWGSPKKHVSHGDDHCMHVSHAHVCGVHESHGSSEGCIYPMGMPRGYMGMHATHGRGHGACASPLGISIGVALPHRHVRGANVFLEIARGVHVFNEHVHFTHAPHGQARGGTYIPWAYMLVIGCQVYVHWGHFEKRTCACHSFTLMIMSVGYMYTHTHTSEEHTHSIHMPMGYMHGMCTCCCHTCIS